MLQQEKPKVGKLKSQEGAVVYARKLRASTCLRRTDILVTSAIVKEQRSKDSGGRPFLKEDNYDKRCKLAVLSSLPQCNTESFTCVPNSWTAHILYKYIVINSKSELLCICVKQETKEVEGVKDDRCIDNLENEYIKMAGVLAIWKMK